MTRKVAPSQMVREQIEHTLSSGVDTESNLLSTLAQLGMKHLLVQQALEAEQEDFLGRGRYERRADSAQGHPYRNGYEEAGLSTAEGEVGVKMPQVRGTSEPYRSKLMEFFLAIQMLWSAWSRRCTKEGSPPVMWRIASRTSKEANRCSRAPQSFRDVA